MVTPAVIWICVAAFSLAVLIMMLVNPERHRDTHSDSDKNGRHAVSPLSLGSEREELFVPGDPLNGQIDENDD